jgi:hypothetical protein
MTDKGWYLDTANPAGSLRRVVYFYKNDDSEPELLGHFPGIDESEAAILQHQHQRGIWFDTTKEKPNIPVAKPLYNNRPINQI